MLGFALKIPVQAAVCSPSAKPPVAENEWLRILYAGVCMKC
jgi:hypothetical protein